MLRQILSTFETSPGPLSLDLLATQLGMDRIVLEGMLVELVAMGRLVRIEDRSGSVCAACGIKKRCPYVLSVTGAYYALPGMVPPATGC